MMKKILLNEKGAVLLLSVAVIVILISVISAISLMGIVRFDNQQVQYSNDMLQQETLLRSERQRTTIIMQNIPNQFPMTDHTVTVESNGKKTHYYIDNQAVVNTGTVKIGPTLITARRGREREFDYGGVDYGVESPIRRYAECLLQGRSLAQYQYFTMHEYSENDEYAEDDPVKFWGRDELFGPVHSNDDIWIQNGGGGSNNGWPTFHAMVTTNKIFKLYPTGEPAAQNAPMDDIFLGGWQENAGFINISAGNAIEIRQNGFQLSDSEGRDILFVKIDGSTATCRYADIVSEPDTFTVFNSFPDPQHAFTVGDSIWTNHINVRETEWDENTFNLTVLNSSVFVHCKLWIEGTVSGMQTWGCADTIFITDDLLYNTVDPGEAPGLTDPDMLGLVSEERIYIQYKNYDPDTEEINIGNVDGSDVYLYGSFAAIGDGDQDIYGNLSSHYEGIFSFYYQHPHGSTPGFTIYYPNGQEWEVEYPDFHKFIFPPSPYWTGDPGFNLHGGDPVGFSCGYPFENPAYGSPDVPPYGTDWPWYNPVWPEGVNQTHMGERGEIIMYGGVQQYRRGFVHRSGSDPLNHPNNEWSIEEWHYDGTHGPTGYDKDYHWDDRITYGMLPPDYPSVYEGLGSTTLFYSSSGWTIKIPPEN